MDLNEETKKLGGNAVIRYALLLLGLLVFLLSQSVLTWKSTSARDASGVVDAVQLEISNLQKKASDAEKSDDKKKYREQADELKKNDLEDARMEAAEESVDAKRGVWFWSMARLKGAALMCLGLLVISAVGSNHEKVGALVALALIVTKL